MVKKTYTNGDRYEGDWNDSGKNGQGTLFYANGGKYVGEWADNMRNGEGTNIWSNGDRYEGAWKNNKKHGQGTFYHADGGKYVGEWADDMRNGQGVNTWSGGNRYEGSWKNNKKHGQGTYTYADGGKYVGEWADDNRNGYGVNTWANGNRFEGAWKANVQHGHGKLVCMNGMQDEGDWLNGQHIVLSIKMPNSSGCPYLALAHEFLRLLKWAETFFDASFDRCYCNNCYKAAWKNVIEAGEGKYVIPRGWVRLGLHVDPVIMKTQEIWNKWIVTFHGTTKTAALSILTHRQFCLPGDVLIDGTKLAIRPGHIPNQMYIFTSPTIAYSSSSVYSPIINFHSTQHNIDCEAQIVLQCRQMPKSYKIGPETIGAGTKRICPFIPNTEIEYFTDRRASLIAYGLLIRVRQKNG